MKQLGNVKVLFIAGFGPIVRDTTESRKLYGDTLGIPFKEESGEYLHTGSPQRRKDLCTVATLSGRAVVFW